MAIAMGTNSAVVMPNPTIAPTMSIARLISDRTEGWVKGEGCSDWRVEVGIITSVLGSMLNFWFKPTREKTNLTWGLTLQVVN